MQRVRDIARRMVGQWGSNPYPYPTPTLTLPLPLPLPLPRYNSTTCPEQRAVRLENVRQGLGEGQWMQRHDGRVLLRMNSTAAQEGEARHHKGELSVTLTLTLTLGQALAFPFP